MEPAETSGLLRKYAEEGCEEAFSLLMHRYVDLVYSAALRRLEGDSAAAEDIVQRVFTELAIQARSLKADSRLGGWLYRCAVRFAADVHKAAARRRRREVKAAALTPLITPETDAWEEVAPRLDDAMQLLSSGDRDALVLRFFENRPLRAVGDALGLSEDAAQKRVSRALIRLRGLLRKRGVATTAGGLAGGLTSNSVASAPPGLAASVLPSALPVSSLVLTIQSIMNAKPLIAAAALVAVVSIPLYLVFRPEDASSSEGRRQTASVMSRPATSTHSEEELSTGKAAASSKSALSEKKTIASPGSDGGQTSEAEALAKTRKRAEEITLKRFAEKMERLTRKLNLTPEQTERIAAHHQAQRTRWIEYMTAAAFEKADAQYYQLEAGYREDVPPSLQTLLSEDQLKQYRDHDANKRTNHIEAVTSGEINYLAQRLDLDPQRKDALFESLADINRIDLFSDLSQINDIAGIATQADQDLARRRASFAGVLDAQQMTVWEEVVAGYRKDLLHRFGQRESATAEANGEKRAGDSRS